MQLQRRVFAGQPIEPFSLKSLTAKRPQNVRQVLLRERYFCLDGELDVIQPRIRTTIWCDAGEYPTAALLIHQATRSVDRIHNDAPNSIRLLRPARQNDLAVFQPLGDEHQRRVWRHFSLEEVDQQLFAHTIEREDRIALLFADDGCKLVQSRAFTGFDNRSANLFVQPTHWLKKLPNVVRRLLRHFIDSL